MKCPEVMDVFGHVVLFCFLFFLFFLFLTITVLRSDFVCCVASFTRLTVTHVESDWLYGVCVVIKFSFYSRGRDDHYVCVRCCYCSGTLTYLHAMYSSLSREDSVTFCSYSAVYTQVQ